VVSVDPDGPAGKAGIGVRDLVVGIGEKSVATVDDIHLFLSDWQVGQAVELVVVRGKDRLKLQVVPVESA
jgi:S1-C subfamily serine protease